MNALPDGVAARATLDRARDALQCLLRANGAGDAVTNARLLIAGAQAVYNAFVEKRKATELKCWHLEIQRNLRLQPVADPSAEALEGPGRDQIEGKPLVDNIDPQLLLLDGVTIAAQRSDANVQSLAGRPDPTKKKINELYDQLRQPELTMSEAMHAVYKMYGLNNETVGSNATPTQHYKRRNTVAGSAALNASAQTEGPTQRRKPRKGTEAAAAPNGGDDAGRKPIRKRRWTLTSTLRPLVNQPRSSALRVVVLSRAYVFTSRPYICTLYSLARSCSPRQRDGADREGRSRESKQE